jgi:2-C-methyl-D-erythritol 2,4-cyclodiphosphate synthase
MMRIGHGFDVHKFGGVGPCMLGGGGAYEQGLLAHSDGDVVLHAVSDAPLGPSAPATSAATFPIPPPNSRASTAASRCGMSLPACSAGYAIGNLDVTIIAQAPDGPHIDAMCAVLAAICNVI